MSLDSYINTRMPQKPWGRCTPDKTSFPQDLNHISPFSANLNRDHRSPVCSMCTTGTPQLPALIPSKVKYFEINRCFRFGPSRSALEKVATKLLHQGFIPTFLSLPESLTKTVSDDIPQEEGSLFAFTALASMKSLTLGKPNAPDFLHLHFSECHSS